MIKGTGKNASCKSQREFLDLMLKNPDKSLMMLCSISGLGWDRIANWILTQRTFRNYAKRHCEANQAWVEGKLFNQIKSENIASIIFYLKTNHPAYSEKVKKIKDSEKNSKEAPKNELDQLQELLDKQEKGNEKEGFNNASPIGGKV